MHWHSGVGREDFKTNRNHILKKLDSMHENMFKGGLKDEYVSTYQIVNLHSNTKYSFYSISQR